jgi:acyl carrier protein
MGLDLVELHLAIEDEFAVTLPAGSFPSTVGELHAMILMLIQRNSDWSKDVYACIPAFFVVRDGLKKVMSSNPRIRPSTVTESILPRYGRLRLWEQLEAELCCQLPTLKSPTGVGGAVFLGWLGTCSIGLTLSFLMADGPGLLLGMLLGVPLVTMLAMHLERRLRFRLPDGFETVSGLVRHVLPANKAAALKTSSSDQVWVRLRNIVSDQLDVPLELVRTESHFVRDLKCD